MKIVLNTIILTVFFWFSESCSDKSKNERVPSSNSIKMRDSSMRQKKDSISKLKKLEMDRVEISTIEDIFKQEETYWFSKDYYPYLILSKNGIQMDFDVANGDIFKYKIQSDKILVYFEGVSSEINSFRKISVSKPKRGELFMELYLINDSTLLAKYLTQTWVMEMNHIMKKYNENDFFADTFYLRNF